MKFFATAVIFGLSFFQAYADSGMKRYEIQMALWNDKPLEDVIHAAPELMIEKTFRAAKKDTALTTRAIFTIEVIGSAVRAQSENLRTLKDLKVREAAVKYTESISAMSDAVLRHLSGAEGSIPDIEKWVRTVGQRRAELVSTFPMLEQRKK
jgi:hypothetical protein